MRVVLLETADSGEASQRSRQLVSVQDTEVGHAEGQLSPGTGTVIKHQAGAKQHSKQKVKKKTATVSSNLESPQCWKIVPLIRCSCERLSVIFDVADNHHNKTRWRAQIGFKCDVQRTAERARQVQNGDKGFEHKDLQIGATFCSAAFSSKWNWVVL